MSSKSDFAASTKFRRGLFPTHYPLILLGTLQSNYMTMPLGKNFLTREDFQKGYRVLDQETASGTSITEQTLLSAVEKDSRCWVILRSMTGLTPPELGHAIQEAGKLNGEDIDADQSLMRSIDAKSKQGKPLISNGKKPTRIDSVVRASMPHLASLLTTPPAKAPNTVHRLDKIDTERGSESIAEAFKEGVSYSELLYERVLGRPFASHKDSVSGQVGDFIEDALEELLKKHKVDYARTKPREVIKGFEQAPDFRIPADNPKVIIEAKVGEDDGTARDKVARVRTLRQNEDKKKPEDRCTVVAVIDGRGFAQRTKDLKRLLEATENHTYSLAEVDQLFQPGGVLEPFLGTSKT